MIVYCVVQVPTLKSRGQRPVPTKIDLLEMLNQHRERGPRSLMIAESVSTDPWAPARKLPPDCEKIRLGL